MEILEPAVQISIIGAAVWGVFSYAALRPLSDNIARLGQDINKLGVAVERIADRQREIEIKLTEVEQRTRSAHHRIDEINKHLGIGGRQSEGVEH